MTNPSHTVLYTGMTGRLSERIYEHKQKLVKGFTSRYNVIKLVHVEIFENAYDAITREKQIKAGSRKRKIKLIEKSNSEWRDLSDEID